MEEENKKLLIRSVIIGGIIGSVVIAASSKSKVSGCMTTCSKTTADFFKFLNENRSGIIDQMKAASSKVTKAIDDTNSDLKAISGNIKKLKTSSAEVIQVAQDTKDQLMTMFESTKKKNDAEIITENIEEKKVT
ncbi:hypothetical protein RJD24_20625 [Bacillaceae bacterium IKA-2]|jgi:cell shape-determining protein MreC|nr:hypothetical protein RJD24_20625 [Bacillaceae bacterium IKA-2]